MRTKSDRVGQYELLGPKTSSGSARARKVLPKRVAVLQQTPSDRKALFQFCVNMAEGTWEVDDEAGR